MNIAILGLGVVGRGVYDIINDLHPSIHIKYVLELDNSKLEGITSIQAKEINEILQDEEIDTIVELIGGKTIAYDFIKLALQNHKHVVTANKAVISEYFEELTNLATNNNVQLRYEASVGGGIIVLNTLLKLTKVNPITEIKGIINGSTNFILSKIFAEDFGYQDAFNLALEKGFIETYSTDDMEGLDLLRKINILSMISYHQCIDEKDIIRVPLTSLSDNLYNYVKSMNKVIKYVAFSSIQKRSITIQLEPVALDTSSPFAQVNYEQNSIVINGKYHYYQTFTGLGAGRYPTASAVVYDLLQLQSNISFDVQASDLGYSINTSPRRGDYLIETKDGFDILNNQTINDIQKMPNIISFVRMGE